MDGVTGTGGTASQVVWEREIDPAAQAGRWRKLGLFYGAPMAVALVVASVLGGLGAFLGVLILLGLFGLMLVALVFFTNFNARANSRIKLGDGHLVMGQRRVDLARVEAWSTRASAERWAVSSVALRGNPMAGNAITAEVLFRVAVHDQNGQREIWPNGRPAFEVVGFSWAEMPPDQLDRLRAALDPYITAPLVHPDNLRN